MSKKLRSGQPLAAIQAVDLNRAFDAGDYVAQHFGTGSAAPNFKTVNPHTEIRIKNNSSGNLAAGKVLKLGVFSLDEMDNQFIWFEGGTPTDRISPFAVLLKPLTVADEFGPALMSGVCIASVDVQHTGHRWADTTTSTTLLSYPTGAARIISPLSTTGVQDCVVHLGQVFRGPLLGKPDADIAQSASGTVSVYTGARVDTTSNVTAYNLGDQIDAGLWCMVYEIDGVYYVTPEECSSGAS